MYPYSPQIPVCVSEQCSIKYVHSKFFALQPINIIPSYYKYIAKSVLMVKIASYNNSTVIIITIM